MNKLKNIFNINFEFNRDNITQTIDTIISSNQKGYICAVNANIVVEANKNKNYLNIVNSSIFNICDGSNVAMLGSKIENEKLHSYPGPDFFIDTIISKKYKSFFLGSTEDILLSLKEKLQKHDENVKNMEFLSPPFKPLDDFDYKGIAKIIDESGADIIWVSLGAPKQEQFMYRLQPFLKRGIMVGVGAAFTFYGDDRIKRAPIFLRKLKLEWLYRVVMDPKKILPRLTKQFIHLPLIYLKEKKKKRD